MMIKKNRLLFLLPLFLVLFSSCYSYHIFPKEDRAYKFTGPKEKAYVSNPELFKEYKYVQSSGIFQLTDDSTMAHIIQVTLRPLQRKSACGEPVLLSLLTLGQVPVYYPDRQFISFSETRNGETVQRNFALQIARRSWFWDLFSHDKKYSVKAGQAMLAIYHKRDQLTSRR